MTKTTTKKPRALTMERAQKDADKAVLSLKLALQKMVQVIADLQRVASASKSTQTTAPKRLGRPPKAKASSLGEAVLSAPKRRGRPPKRIALNGAVLKRGQPAAEATEAA